MKMPGNHTTKLHTTRLPGISLFVGTLLLLLAVTVISTLGLMTEDTRGQLIGYLMPTLRGNVFAVDTGAALVVKSHVT